MFLWSWLRAMREIRRTPEGAFAALGTASSTWETMLWLSGPLATDRAPGWYADQNDASRERWFDGRAWTDLVR